MTNRPLLTTPTLVKHPLSLPLHHRNNIPFSIARHIAAISSSSDISSIPNLTENFDALMSDHNIDTVDNGASLLQQQSTAISDIVTDNNMISSNNQQLAPTYSNPIETSEGYLKGFLKSDYNISSNHPSIRLAFRYVKDKKSNDTVEEIEKSEEVEDGASGTDDDMTDADKPDTDIKKQADKKESLYLCWINQDGIPCHFRPLNPTAINCNNDFSATNDINGHGNLRGGASTNQPTTSSVDISNNHEEDTITSNLLLVNEHDHIETTFPGHAFVFCRRVDNDTVRQTTDTSTNDNEDGNDESNEDDSVLIVQENDRTYFIRKCNTTQDDENDSIQRETYLAVGGFRPDPMPERGEADHEEEGKTEEEGEESESESDDDSFDGGRELDVQLVTIKSIQNKSVEKESPSSVGEAEDSDDEDIDLPSSALGCSDCTQSVPFLRGAMNPRPPHTNAFVATAPILSNDNIESDAPSGHQEEPTHNHDEDTEPSLQVSVCLTRLDPTPIDTSKKHYDKVILGGWPCNIEPGCFPSDMDIPANGKNLLRTRFESDLEAASKSLPFEAREKLKSSTPVWINKSQSFGPKVAPVMGRAGCFHPGSKWLKRNGMNPAKCGGVEWYDAKHYLSDCDLWGAGGLMLHELSHAWHCLHIEDGYDNEDIINVYKAAMDEGLYDCVRVHGKQGPSCKAYACQDQMEYFAELSVAFLGTEIDEDREHNKWYPFNRRQLREHDPRAYELLCRMWGVTNDNDVQSITDAQAPSEADRNDE